MATMDIGQHDPVGNLQRRKNRRIAVAHLWNGPYPAGVGSFHAAVHPRLARETGKPLRLPTAVEWEAFARGGLEGRLFPYGKWTSTGRGVPDEANTRDRVLSQRPGKHR